MILTHLNFRGNKIPIHVIRKNKKLISIRLKTEDEIIVTTPKHVTDDFLFEVLKRKEKWLIEKLNIIHEQNRTIDSLKSIQARQILYRNRLYPIVFSDSIPQFIVFSEDTFFINQAIAKSYDTFLKHWFQQKCWQFLEEYIPYWAEKIGVNYSSFRVSKAKSYWGTCDSKGKINISWRIMMAPEAVNHYLIIHELCHLVCMNHSKQFWQVVETVFPDYKKAKKWLKEHAHILRDIHS
jgi:predicted metal-dependent hydrolase